MVRAIRLLAGLGVVLLVACASGPQAPALRQAGSGAETDAVADRPAPESDGASANYPVRAFPTQTLYALLAAETAGIRGDIDFALRQYLEQARTTGDPGVISRAAHIAEYAGDDTALAELGQLWVEREPEDPQARELAAAGLARQGRLLEALPHAVFLLEQGSGQSIRLLTGSAARRPQTERDALLAAYDELAPAFPDSPDLLFGRALLRWQAGGVEEARKLAERAVALQPDNPAGHLLFAQLLEESGLSAQAFEHLERVLPRYPEDTRLSRAYVHMLLGRRDFARAVARLESQVTAYPDNAVLRFGLALAYRGADRPEAAREQLTMLVEDPELSGDAYFQLGQLADSDGHVERAIQYYRRVQGEHWLAATARAARLLADSGELAAARRYLARLRATHQEQLSTLFQIEAELLMHRGEYRDAQELLDAGLEEIPGSIELLYSRSLAHEKLGDIAAVEADLRAILAMDADNASALNALGYSLANHTDRYEEAQHLIERALALAPNDAAIIDSLGWVLYRRGQHERALVELRRAAALLPDPEVAAHLGEVLWVMGEREQARSVWAEALERFPDDRMIRETMQRLQVDS